ncbi:FliH/SctL family protein [Escherichia coli]
MGTLNHIRRNTTTLKLALMGDPTLHPGGCKVSADEGDLDASVATRWQELCRLAAPGVV